MSRLKRIAAVVLAMLMGGCAAKTRAAGLAEGVPTVTAAALAERLWSQGEDPDAVRLFAANVGKGDALILRVKDYVCLIDAGKTWARGRVVKGLELMGVGAEDGLDAVFLTHTDDDHAGGLDWLADGSADALYASAMYTGVKEGKHPALEAAQAMTPSGEVRWLRRGDAIPLGDTGATLRVLAPASLFQDKDDNNSLVMLLESDQGRVLFTGDMELPEEAELLSFGDDLSCDVLKAPNHGDDDTTSAAFARACGAKLALISTDSQQKPGTPDPGVVGRLEAAGSRVVVTQDGELGVLVTLSGGEVSAEYVESDAPPVSGVYVAKVDNGDDVIELGNYSEEAVELGGFYLYSDRGNELFAFPDGARIGPGGTLTVGTLSTDGDCDLVWPDKKVVHKKKTDVISLYDSLGRLVDSRDNGE